MGTKKENFEEKMKKLSTEELIKKGYPGAYWDESQKQWVLPEQNEKLPREMAEADIRKEKQTKRWITSDLTARISIAVIIATVLYWLLILADARGWVSVPWLRYFVNPTEEIIRHRQGG